MDAGLNVEDFRRWALGDLAGNRNRGVFAEWLVGRALGAIDDDAARQEWMPWDLEYRGRRIEVKASGQAWNPRPNPRFDIACRRFSWDPETDEDIELDPPARVADVYVFCLHTPVPATNDNVTDPAQWQFWVVPRSTLDDQLGVQKSVGVATLDRLCARVRWSDIRAVVDLRVRDVRRWQERRGLTP